MNQLSLGGVKMPKVILGTAQWGLNYGVTNRAGRLQDTAILDIISCATRLGISQLDTAQAYGDSEDRIGRLASHFACQTKLSYGAMSSGGIREGLKESLVRLGRPRVESVLLHDWASLDHTSQKRAARELETMRDEGYAEWVGVSVYEESEIECALAAFVKLDVIQGPSSLLDQRLVNSRSIERLRDGGGRFQARSIFLQGAALADVSHVGLDKHPDIARIGRLDSPLQECVSFIATQAWVDEVVVAPTSVSELEEIIDCLRNPVQREEWDSLASCDLELIDPRRWQTNK